MVAEKERFEKLIGIKIQVLPTDTVVQWVKHRRDKPRTCVQILASVIFFICSVAFFLSLLPWRSVGRPNFVWDLQNLAMLIQITTYRYKKLLCYKYNELWTFIEKNAVSKTHTHIYIYAYIHTYIYKNVCIYIYIHIAKTHQC